MKSAVGIIYACGSFDSHGNLFSFFSSSIFLPVLKGI